MPESSSRPPDPGTQPARALAPTEAAASPPLPSEGDASASSNPSELIGNWGVPQDPLASTAALPPGVALEGEPPPLILPTDKTVISKRTPGAEPAAPLPPMPSQQKLGESLVGRTLDHYELVEFVGGGGMGAVFRANDTRLGRTVAVKVLSRDQTDDETIRRFRNEAQSAARLDHLNIARVYFVGEAEGWNYIVFEFIEGANLRDVVDERGPLPLTDALNYTLQVAEALHHAASRDVVHRDIKPSNVIVTPTGEIKLVDMGLARLHQVESSSEDLTASGVTLGTFDYISPEQARDPRSADVRSDIYSLGCTLYYMLTGKPPFPDGTALQKLLRHNGVDPPDVRLFRPDLGPPVVQLLAKMLAKRPVDRQQTPPELISQILTVANDLELFGIGARSSLATQAITPPSWWRGLIPIMAPVFALVALLLTVELIQSSQRGDDVDLNIRPRFSKGVATVPPPPPAPVGKESVTEAPTRKTISSAKEPSEKGSGEKGPVKNAPPTPRPAAPAGVEPPAASAVPTGAAESGAKASNPAKESLIHEPAAGGIGPAASAALTGEWRATPSGVEGGISLAPPTSAPPASSPPAKSPVTRIIVRAASGSPAEPAPLDTEIAPSLARACQRAVELNLTDIELQFNGERLEKPFEISSPRLMIRAATGYHPLIVFRPQVQALASDRQMIRAAVGGSGRLQIVGVQMRLELPPEASSGWSLLHVPLAQLVEFSDCVLTIVDSGRAGRPVHDLAAFITVPPRPMAETMMKSDETMAMLPQITLSLQRVIARGEAIFLLMPEESPLKLVWQQGLLVTPYRMIETGGSALKPSEFGRLDLDLNHVTISAARGIHATKWKPGFTHQLNLDVRANHSIVSTDEGAPLFEFQGPASIENVKFSFAGEGNCYPRAQDTLLRFRPANRGESPQDFEVGKKDRWSSQEQRPSVFIHWAATPVPLAERPAHQRLKSEYELDPDAANKPGFESGLLPDILEPARPAPQRQENTVDEGE